MGGFVVVLRLIAAELRHRRGRALALLLGIAVATAAFTVLTGASDSSRLELRGTVAQHFRMSYDLLVRPDGPVPALERTEGLVQQDFLSGLDGGITMAQWRKIQHEPGIDVAAPLAVFGYVNPVARLPVALGPHLLPGTRTAFRVGVRWTTDRGTLTLRDPASYAYVTRQPFDPNAYAQEQTEHSPTVFEKVPHGKSVGICPRAGDAASAFSRAARSWMWCWSTHNELAGGWSSVAPLTAPVEFPIPMIIAAVDPASEAKLSGTDRALTSGHWLGARDATRVSERGASATIPVLAADAPQQDLSADVTVTRLPAATAQDVYAARANRRAVVRALDGARGTVMSRTSYTSAEAYKSLLAQLKRGQPQEAFWTTGPITYRSVGPRHLAAVTTRTDAYNWGASWGTQGAGSGFITTPPGAHDTGFRALDQHIATNDGKIGLTSLKLVGTYDPAKIPGAEDPNQSPLDPFRPAAAPLAAPLGGSGARTLAPDGNLAGYLTPPPTLLTTLSARSVLLSTHRWDDVQKQEGAPLSVVRVRVSGVTGPDRASRERIRVAAQRIVRDTGLHVDVTAGASPTPVTVDLPAGTSGRPALTLREGWIRKGVATAILAAVDRKSVALFVLVLLVCGLFCLNAASAAVRGRATELGVLACVGWRRRQLFVYLLGEVGVVGLTAGVVGLVVALPVGAALGLGVDGSRAAIAVPAATLLALLAGVVPAARAARSDPLAAVRPAVRSAGSARAVRSVRGLAVRNLVRVPGRSVLGVVALAAGVGALTALLAVTAAFRGTVVGTVLGDAVAVQVRTADYVAVAAALALGGLAVADVLYLNLRDRGAELATLRAVGWRERSLTRMVAFEGLGLGLVGGVVGAACGLGGAAAFCGGVTESMWLVAAAAAVLGVVVGVVASVPPAASLRRWPTATLLAEE